MLDKESHAIWSNPVQKENTGFVTRTIRRNPNRFMALQPILWIPPRGRGSSSGPAPEMAPASAPMLASSLHPYLLTSLLRSAHLAEFAQEPPWTSA